MAVRCEDVLAYAQANIELVSCEVGARSVISRAYYSCYHRLLQFHDGLESPGHEPESVNGRTKGVYARLIYALQNPTVQDQNLAGASRHLGRLAKNLYDKRLKADYYLNEMVEKRMALQAVEEAKRLFDFMIKNEL